MSVNHTLYEDTEKRKPNTIIIIMLAQVAHNTYTIILLFQVYEMLKIGKYEQLEVTIKLNLRRKNNDGG
jgi:hypothetical protein